MDNNKILNITSKQHSGLTVGIKPKNKPKRYQVTEKQLKAVLEKSILDKLAKPQQFNTYEKKLDYIQSLNTLVFKEELPNFPRSYFTLTKIKYTEDGRVKLINSHGAETAWFRSMDHLMGEIDWEWLESNLTTKEYD